MKAQIDAALLPCIMLAALLSTLPIKSMRRLPLPEWVWRAYLWKGLETKETLVSGQPNGVSNLHKAHSSCGTPARDA